MPDLDLVLRIDGVNHDGWNNIQVVRSLDTIADTFDLALQTKASWHRPVTDITEGATCEVLYRGAVLVSGYLDTVNSSYNATSTTLTVSGRSKAGQLVDCTAIHKPWRDTPVLTIAAELCEPFGIRVTSEIGELPKEQRFKLAEGEKVFEALARLGKDYALRLVSLPNGDISFTRTGLLRYPDVVIERGVNVFAGSLTRNLEERFSHYVFKAQLAASDELGGEVNTAYTVEDDGVSLYRPLVIESDEQVRDIKGQFTTKEKSKTPLQLRAEWERNTRAGKARQLTYDVGNPDDLASSWEHAHGLWEPNTIVTVRDDFFELDAEFLITQVTLTLDDAGTRTSLALTLPQAYEVEFPPKKKAKAQKGISW